MLSLDNAYSYDELREFDRRVHELLRRTRLDYVTEHKFDGLSISLQYEQGLLVRGVTRGDGRIGEDVTPNVRTIRSIPLSVDPAALKKLRLGRDFEARGEVIMTRKAFEQLNRRQEEQGAKRFANPRSAAAGAVRVLDPAITASRRLYFYAYLLLVDGRPALKRHSEALAALAALQFQVCPDWTLCPSVEEVVASGVPMVIFVTGRGKDAIENHFDISLELEHLLSRRNKGQLRRQLRSISQMLQVTYIRQKEPKGLGHAILTARDLVGDEPFAVALSDDIIESRVPCLKQMMQVFDRYGASVVAIQRVDPKAVSSYGIIRGSRVPDAAWKGRLVRIEDMVEKPAPSKAPSNLAVIGRYILTPRVFGLLARTRPGAGHEIQLTDALRRLLSEEPIYGYMFEGNRYDAGDKLGFLQATVELALKRPDLGKPFRKYLKSLDL